MLRAEDKTKGKYRMFSYDKIQSLNELELSLYSYIIKNSEKVSYMRIRELANEAHVSTTTILRFCKKLNCDGFSEFKIKLKMHIEKGGSNQLTDNTSMLIDFLRKAETEDFKRRIKEICEIISTSNNVVFIGIGFSGILGKYAARYISAVGKFAIYMDDPFFPTSCKNYENSVAIVFSVSGETPTVIDHVNRLKQEKSKIISITNNENCTLAKMSDINMAYYVQQDKTTQHDITTQIPVLYIIETVGKKLYNYYLQYPN